MPTETIRTIAPLDPRTRADEPTTALTVAEWLGDTARRWRTVLSVLLLTGFVGVMAVVLIPPAYRSRASFVANATSASKLPSGLAASAGALGGLASQLGMGSSSDPSESPNFYVQLMQSRELLTRLLVSRFPDPRGKARADSATLLDIMRIREDDRQRQMEIGIKKISKKIKGNFDLATNLVWIDVDAPSPELSAAIANRTVDLVTQFNNEQRLSRLRSKRAFLEERTRANRSAMLVSEARLREFFEQNRTWQSSPGLQAAQRDLQRDVDRASEMYVLVQRQFEMVLMDEENNSAKITVVDTAVPPRKAEWPRFSALVLGTLITGLLLGFLAAGAAAVFANWRARNRESADNLARSLRTVRREMTSFFRRHSPQTP